MVYFEWKQIIKNDLIAKNKQVNHLQVMEDISNGCETEDDWKNSHTNNHRQISFKIEIIATGQSIPYNCVDIVYWLIFGELFDRLPE